MKPSPRSGFQSRNARRLLEDDQVDRPGVYGGQPPQLTGTNSRTLGHIDPLLDAASMASAASSSQMLAYGACPHGYLIELMLRSTSLAADCRLPISIATGEA